MSIVEKLKNYFRKKYFENISKKLFKNALLIEIDEVKTNELSKLFKKTLIGDINICAEKEKWPKANDGTLLLPLIQIKISDLPFVPEYLTDIKYITIFIYPKDMEKIIEDINGLYIRIYNDENLKFFKKPKTIQTNSRLIKFNKVIDFPSYEDLPQRIIEYQVKIL